MAKKAFSQGEKERIAAELSKSISRDCLSVRAGAGGTKLTYIEAWRVISSANRIFGFDGWKSHIYDMTREYFDESKDGRTSVGYSCACRITLQNGAYREDVGFGNAERVTSKGQAIEKAKKEATTDALKRAFRQFGEVLGNCCYNKEFVRKASAIGGKAAVNFSIKEKVEYKKCFGDDDSISFDNTLDDSISG